MWEIKSPHYYATMENNQKIRTNDLMLNIFPIAAFDLSEFLLSQDTATGKVTGCNLGVNLDTIRV